MVSLDLAHLKLSFYQRIPSCFESLWKRLNKISCHYWQWIAVEILYTISILMLWAYCHTWNSSILKQNILIFTKFLHYRCRKYIFRYSAIDATSYQSGVWCSLPALVKLSNLCQHGQQTPKLTNLIHISLACSTHCGGVCKYFLPHIWGCCFIVTSNYYSAMLEVILNVFCLWMPRMLKIAWFLAREILNGLLYDGVTTEIHSLIGSVNFNVLAEVSFQYRCIMSDIIIGHIV